MPTSPLRPVPENLSPRVGPEGREPVCPGEYRILIVDDRPANQEFLAGLLETQGYQVVQATSGKEALALGKDHSVDAVLLDICMPEMDGFQVCEAIRKDPCMARLPVLFLSALVDPQEKVRAFQCGGNDYLTKPFHAAEVVARLSHHLRVSRLERDLALRNAALEMANLQLQEMEQMRAGLNAMLVHDIRSPLSVISAALDMISAGFSTPEEMIPQASEALGRMNDMVTSMLDIYRSGGQSGLRVELKPITLSNLLRRVISNANIQSRQPGIHFRAEVADNLPEVQADEETLERALLNLIGNAIKFTPREGGVYLRAFKSSGAGVDAGKTWVCFEIIDTGPGIPPENLPYIFDPFQQVQPTDSQRGVGLGLAIVQRIVASHRGHIQVRSQLGVGTSFLVCLPAVLS